MTSTGNASDTFNIKISVDDSELKNAVTRQSQLIKKLNADLLSISKVYTELEKFSKKFSASFVKNIDTATASVKRLKTATQEVLNLQKQMGAVSAQAATGYAGTSTKTSAYGPQAFQLPDG
jgi:hypothetical protein